MSLRKILCTTGVVFTTLSTASAQNKTDSETANTATNKAMEYAFLFGFLPAVALSFIGFAMWEMRKILHEKRIEANKTHMSSDLQGVSIDPSTQEEEHKESTFHPDVALVTGTIDSASDEPIELEEVDLGSSTHSPRP